MSNKVQVLDKIYRNLVQLGYAPTRSLYAVTLGNCIVRYHDRTMAAPMGGIDGDTTPFLGMKALPGLIQISGLLDIDAAIVDIFVTASDLNVFRVASAFGNTLEVVAGDTASVASEYGAGAVLATIEADAVSKVLGQ